MEGREIKKIFPNQNLLCKHENAIEVHSKPKKKSNKSIWNNHFSIELLCLKKRFQNKICSHLKNQNIYANSKVYVVNGFIACKTIPF